MLLRKEAYSSFYSNVLNWPVPQPYYYLKQLLLLLSRTEVASLPELAQKIRRSEKEILRLLLLVKRLGCFEIRQTQAGFQFIPRPDHLLYTRHLPFSLDYSVLLTKLSTPPASPPTKPVDGYTAIVRGLTRSVKQNWKLN